MTILSVKYNYYCYFGEQLIFNFTVLQKKQENDVITKLN